MSFLHLCQQNSSLVIWVGIMIQHLFCISLTKIAQILYSLHWRHAHGRQQIKGSVFCIFQKSVHGVGSKSKTKKSPNMEVPEIPKIWLLHILDSSLAVAECYHNCHSTIDREKLSDPPPTLRFFFGIKFDGFCTCLVLLSFNKSQQTHANLI